MNREPKSRLFLNDLRFTIDDLLIHYSQKMRNLIHDTTHPGRILTRNRLVKLGNAQVANDRFLLFGVSDRTFVVLDIDRSASRIFCFLCHFFKFLEFRELLEFMELRKVPNSPNPVNSTNSKLDLPPVYREAVQPQADPSFAKAR